MLLTGLVSDKASLFQLRTRLVNIKIGLAKISVSHKANFTPQSVERRLDSPFWLPQAKSYSDVKTHTQQAKINAAVR